jgi:hypothetical protein
MDLGHGFLPRIDARNYKAVERCLPRDGPGLFNVDLDPVRAENVTHRL